MPESDYGLSRWQAMIANADDGSVVTACPCGMPKMHQLLGTPCGDIEAMERKMAEATPTNAHLERRDLRAFHRKLQDFCLRVCNVEGYAYRRSRNAIIIYPPDGSEPITIHARNTERQLRSINQWYAKHNPSVTEVSADTTVDVTVTPATLYPLPTPVIHDPDDWQTHFSDNGDPVENFETNGHVWRCRLCVGTPDAYESSSPTGIGGHNRMKHSDTTSMFSPEARAKGIDTKRFNRLSRQIESAVVTLAGSIGWEAGPGVQEKMAALEAENADLRRKLGEAEARLALMREAMNA